MAPAAPGSGGAEIPQVHPQNLQWRTWVERAEVDPGLAVETLIESRDNPLGEERTRLHVRRRFNLGANLDPIVADDPDQEAHIRRHGRNHKREIWVAAMVKCDES